MSASKVLKMMKDKQIEFVDLRFTDPLKSICGLIAKGKAKTDYSGFVLDTQ